MTSWILKGRLWLTAAVGLSGISCSGSITARHQDDRGGDDAQGGGGGGSDVTPPPGSAGLDPDPVFVPPPRQTPFTVDGGLQRLSAAQFANTITDLFGAKFAANLEVEVDFRGLGFTSIGGRQVPVSPSGVRKYEDTAIKLAAAILADLEQRRLWIDCTPAGPADAACMRQFVAKVGRRLFRQPLSGAELDRHAQVGGNAAKALNDFHAGARYALTGLLLSPRFTYHAEVGEDTPAGRRLTGFEQGSRLSYLIWGTTPDEPLLQAAGAGQLADAGQLAAQVDRLLGDGPRVARGLRGFVEGYVGLHLLADTPKDTVKFPVASPAGKATMSEALHRMVNAVLVEGDRGFADIFSSGFVFANKVNAPALGLTLSNTELVRTPLPPDGLRVGLLTEPAVLTMTARQSETSPTLRGKFVNELLCFVPPPPPADAVTTLGERQTGTSKRQQIEAHMDLPACATCHELMDPVGFGLENFDAVGAIQLRDNGVEVDATGNLRGEPFDGPRELSALVARHDDTTSCFVERVYSHALGHAPVEDEAWVVSALVERVRRVGGGRYAELMRDIVLSPGFVQAPAL